MGGMGVVMANDDDNKENNNNDAEWGDDGTKNKSQKSISPQEAMRKGRALFQGKIQDAAGVPPTKPPLQPGANPTLAAGAITDAQKQAIVALLAEANIQASFNAAQQIQILVAQASALRVNAVLMQYGLVNKKIPNVAKVSEWLNNPSKKNELKAALSGVLTQAKQEVAPPVTQDEVKKEAQVSPVATKSPVTKPPGALPRQLTDAQRNALLKRRNVIADDAPQEQAPAEVRAPVPTQAPRQMPAQAPIQVPAQAALFLPPPIISAVNTVKRDATSTYFGFTEGANGGKNVYNELLQTEAEYMGFLGAFDQNDMNAFLSEYDKLSQEELKGYATKEQLRAVFEKLTELRAAQAELLALLHEPNPQLWADKYGSLAGNYQSYIAVAGGLMFPLKVDQIFWLIKSPR